MDNENNDLLILGISILGIGLLLTAYSVSTYLEIKSLSKKIDFELIDDNNDMSNSDKYYKYLSNADFLNQKLEHNKNILIKNSSCIYLDYAQHNAIELYKLTNNKINMTESQKSVSAGIIRNLYTRLDDYRTCKQTEKYKKELSQILSDIQKQDDFSIESERRYNKFINTSANQEIQPQQDIQNSQVMPEENTYTPQAAENAQTQTQNQEQEPQTTNY